MEKLNGVFKTDLFLLFFFLIILYVFELGGVNVK